MARAIQVVTGGVCTSAIMVEDEAEVTPSGDKAVWQGGEFLAPEGTTFMDVAGAQIGWRVSGSTLVVPPAAPAGPPTPEQIKALAVRLLTESDAVVMHFYENGQPFPQEWRDYRVALRAIAASGVLPNGKTPVTPPIADDHRDGTE